MDRRPAAAVALILLALPALAVDPPPAIPVHGGDRVYGGLDSAQDTDAFSIEVPEGARLVATVAAGKGSLLLPTFALQRPDGTSWNLGLSIQGEGSSTVTIPPLLLAGTGDYVVTVRGFAGTSGDYLATFAVLFPAVPKQTVVVPAGETLEVPFPAVDGGLVSYAAKERSGGPLAAARIEEPEGGTATGSEGVRKGATLGAKGVALEGGPGLYLLLLEGNPDGPTTVDLKASVKLPKVAKRKLRLGPEPRPTSLSPATGRDGAVVTLQGTGFVEGSRIVFDGTADAADVVLAGDGSLSGKAPKYAGGDAGADATVRVVNPDGQAGSVAATFRFLGIPAPLVAQPSLSPVAGGGTVLVTGARFRAGTTVRFGGVPATNVALLGGTQLTCTVPAHASGDVTLEVLDEFGRPGAMPGSFQYSDAPSVTSATPPSLASFGGATITVTGQEFTAGVRAFLDGVEASGVVVASRTSLSFPAPPGAAGPATIEVRDTLDRSGSKVGAVTLTESFQDVTASAVPAATPGADFPGASVVLGDLSGDGLPDVLLASPVPHVNTISNQKERGTALLLNGGTGLFSDGTSSKLGSAFSGPNDFGQADSLLLGDLDGSGPLEILVSRGTPLRTGSLAVTYQGYTCYYRGATPGSFDFPLAGATRFLRATTGNSFSDLTSSRIAATPSTPAFGNGERWQASAAALGDLDGDSDLDLLLAAPGRVDTGSVSQVQWTYKKLGYYYYYYYVKDKGYLTQTSTQVGGTRILRNNGSGLLTIVKAGPVPLLASNGVQLDSFRADACAAGDLDGDGRADAVLLSKTPTLREPTPGTTVNASGLRILFSNASATLALDTTALPAAYADSNPGSTEFWQGSRLLLGDLDSDGDLDIVVGRDQVGYWTNGAGQARLAPAIRIFRNLGSRKFAEDTEGFLDASLFRTGSSSTILGARGIALVDVDRDGKRDLLVTGRQAAVTDAGGGMGALGILPAGTRSATRVLLRNAAGKFVDATAARLPPPSSGSVFQGDSLGAADLDGDGTADLVLAMDTAPSDGKRPVRVLLSK